MASLPNREDKSTVTNVPKDDNPLKNDAKNSQVKKIKNINKYSHGKMLDDLKNIKDYHDEIILKVMPGVPRLNFAHVRKALEED